MTSPPQDLKTLRHRRNQLRAFLAKAFHLIIGDVTYDARLVELAVVP